MITSGEWIVSDVTRDKTSIVVGDVLVAEAHHGTSHSWRHSIDVSEAKDNARLIAAAPKLLAACMRYKERMDTGGIINKDCTGLYNCLKNAIAEAITT